MDLTILMPCFNEQDSIKYAILDAKRLIEKLDVNAEILIADNGSTDDSKSIAKSMGCRVINVRNKGYGNALRAGIKAARGNYIIFADCDGSYKFSEFGVAYYRALTSGCNAVFGDRLSGKWDKDAQSFSHRFIGVPFLSFIGRLFYRCGIHDFHCGLMGFRSSFVKSLKLKATGFEFSSEIIGKSCRNTKKYIQMPIILYPDRRDKVGSNLNSIRDGIRHLIMIIFDVSLN